MKNSVFIATSIDGYIADKDGGIDWLNMVPNPDLNDMGYLAFMETVDALVTGRKTFETVLGFNVPWPYDKPVFVWSTTLAEIPVSHKNKAFLVKGTVVEILAQIHKKGFDKLYIDGGTTIRSFLKEQLIDEMILTTIPVVLGGGASLFGDLPQAQQFKLEASKTFLGEVTQRCYKRI